MNQQVLFHDTIYDALGADIAAAGGLKFVAGKLWPSESPTNAAAKLRNAINPEQAHKLCPEEVLQIKRLAKEKGSTATVDYEARDLGFKIEWVAPEDELGALVRDISEDFDRIEARQKRIENLLTTRLKAVK